jgi:hypothetical protein
MRVQDQPGLMVLTSNKEKLLSTNMKGSDHFRTHELMKLYLTHYIAYNCRQSLDLKASFLLSWPDPVGSNFIFVCLKTLNFKENYP